MLAPKPLAEGAPDLLSLMDSANRSTDESARPPVGPKPIATDPRERASRVWYRIAALISRKQKDLAIDIIEGEIRSAQHDALHEAERLVVSGFGTQTIAKELRKRAERTIRPLPRS